MSPIYSLQKLIGYNRTVFSTHGCCLSGILVPFLVTRQVTISLTERKQYKVIRPAHLYYFCNAKNNGFISQAQSLYYKADYTLWFPFFGFLHHLYCLSWLQNDTKMRKQENPIFSSGMDLKFFVIVTQFSFNKWCEAITNKQSCNF